MEALGKHRRPAVAKKEAGVTIGPGGLLSPIDDVWNFRVFAEGKRKTPQEGHGYKGAEPFTPMMGLETKF